MIYVTRPLKNSLFCLSWLGGCVAMLFIVIIFLCQIFENGIWIDHRVPHTFDAVVHRPDTPAAGADQLETGTALTGEYPAARTYGERLFLFTYCTNQAVFHDVVIYDDNKPTADCLPPMALAPIQSIAGFRFILFGLSRCISFSPASRGMSHPGNRWQ